MKESIKFNFTNVDVTLDKIGQEIISGYGCQRIIIKCDCRTITTEEIEGDLDYTNTYENEYEVELEMTNIDTFEPEFRVRDWRLLGSPNKVSSDPENDNEQHNLAEILEDAFDNIWT